MSRFGFLITVFSGLALHVAAQGYQVVFPGLSGPQLIDSVASRYRPATVLDYANARDTLYGRILSAADDSIRCIYSGHTVYLEPGQDPTQYIYQNGGTGGINTEHAYPQAKGAMSGTNAYSDMHHLYPTRIAVNEARGDKPFAEIPDQQTQKWFLNNQVQTSIPTNHIDLYAESGSTNFEPKEASKGDIARSVLYFYTVYRSQANAADPLFFEQQRQTLCQWNALDPVDSLELWKTWKIAGYQDGKPNPFVIDCSLAKRTWCPETNVGCILSTGEPSRTPPLEITVTPTPSNGFLNAKMVLPFGGDLVVRVISLLGQEINVYRITRVQSGDFVLPMDLGYLLKQSTWVGFLEVNLTGEEGFLRSTRPVLLAK